MMDCTFQVGDEVSCTSVEGADNSCDLALPEVGAVYTVAEISPAKHPEQFPVGWEVGVRLKEIDVPSHVPGMPMFYPHGWFRRVEKPRRETSIETFRRIDREVFAKPRVTA